MALFHSQTQRHMIMIIMLFHVLLFPEPHEATRLSVQHLMRDPTRGNAMTQTNVIVVLAYFS